ncbi:phospholipase D family protein [Variovorax guangxiensis]|uniref:phospholipase D family protein n=1 Tax=Variovorax guangxiensis TaxID=1775474 RepID=UPI0028641838|nr:phospholipase D family protein [Variovorax guangxiensis]MDR6860397.1 phosphatidylserine/phosphatidylglycerophosphate/cardiolipin synthase-like enzyme [Variovorax guangxiensis]
MPVMKNCLQHTLAMAFAVLLTACASLPPGRVGPDTEAISDWNRTQLHKTVLPALPADGRSGFRLQPYGPTAFATRIALARLATRSIDVQYFLLAPDNTGLALLRELRDAAARGVRVRILLDDFNTVGEDELLLALSSYPNVQVRLFNPYPAGRWSIWSRFAASAPDFNRLNRRMHNKLFVADNVAAVTGGRNVAHEYAMNNAGSNFLDMDLFVAGPMVRDLSDAFDHYWNSEVAHDVSDVVSSALGASALQSAFEKRAASALSSTVGPLDGERVIGHSTGDSLQSVTDRAAMLALPEELTSGRLNHLVPARGRVLFDPLSKTHRLGALSSENSTVTQRVVEWMQGARARVTMVTPYFVPDDEGIEALIGASSRGLKITLITNSLASTDVPLAYVAYWRRLEPLLRAGVNVTEVSPSLSCAGIAPAPNRINRKTEHFRHSRCT